MLVFQHKIIRLGGCHIAHCRGQKRRVKDTVFKVFLHRVKIFPRAIFNGTVGVIKRVKLSQLLSHNGAQTLRIGEIE